MNISVVLKLNLERMICKDTEKIKADI